MLTAREKQIRTRLDELQAALSTPAGHDLDGEALVQRTRYATDAEIAERRDLFAELKQVQARAERPLSSLSDTELLKAVYDRTQTHQTPAMQRYVLRAVRYHYRNPNTASRELTDAELNTILQDAWEDGANRE